MRRKTLKITFILLLTTVWLSSCNKFLFFNVEVDEENNPIMTKKMPRTSADFFEPPIVSDDALGEILDEDGVFNQWATCLVLLKEGHSHGDGKLHGNVIMSQIPWAQEQLAVIHNTKEGIKVEVDRKTTITSYEKNGDRDALGPDYLRIVGGGKLWGFCLYFFDKNGNLINDKILDASENYQIFFTVSDKDDQNNDYEVMDLWCRDTANPEPIPAAFFANKTTFEERREATKHIFKYTYRDTWHHDDMGDGARDLFNIKLLPPLSKEQFFDAKAPEDQEYVGLKGHFRFDSDHPECVHPDDAWCLTLQSGLGYQRGSRLLPHFYLAVRVMKKLDAQKAIFPKPSESEALSAMVCAPFDYSPMDDDEWKEIIRFNLPMKVYTSSYDSDPTSNDPNEPYYYHLGREIKLSPDDVYEACKNMGLGGNMEATGTGYGSWFL